MSQEDNVQALTKWADELCKKSIEEGRKIERAVIIETIEETANDLATTDDKRLHFAAAVLRSIVKRLRK